MSTLSAICRCIDCQEWDVDHGCLIGGVDDEQCPLSKEITIGGEKWKQP
jgi:hypothetical protein